MEKKQKRTNKYLLLALILIAVFVLPGCRTRITNNSEVANIQYDEDGYMSETYQMRRDELGLSTAERPLLPNFGSGETDDNDDFSEGESIDYNPEDYQEDFTEPETNTNTTTNTNTNTNTNTGTRTTTRRTTPTTRRSTTGTTTTDTYTVTFNANGGKVNGNSTYQVKVKKNSKLSSKISKFPTAKKGSQSTTKWTTSQNGGSTVKLSDKISGSITLWADWDSSGGGGEDKPTTNKYKVTFTDGKGKTLSEQQVEEGKAATEPEHPTRKGFTFTGWDNNFSKITAETVVNATWDPKKNDSDYWDYVTDEDVKRIEDQPLCYVDGGESTIVQDCSAKATRKEEDLASANYVVAYASDDEEANTLKEKHSGKELLIISKDATKADKQYRAVYRLIILKWLHGTDINYKEAADNLKIDYKIYYPEEV